MNTGYGKLISSFPGQQWSGLFALLATFLAVSASVAQTPTRNQLVGTWVGVHTELDKGYLCPLPTYIRLQADSTYQLGMIDGSAPDITSTWAITNNQVQLDTIHFAPNLVILQENRLVIGKNYPMTFRKFDDILLDSAAVYQQLSGRVWQSDSLTLSFYKNGQIALENLLSKRRTAHFWQLATFGTSVFIVVRGNQSSRDGNYKALWQLSSLSAKQIQAIGWNGHSITVENYRLQRNLTPGDTCRPNTFQPCDNCFIAGWSQNQISRSDKRYDLNQLLTTYYTTVNRTDQSGLIHIQFVVNCEGKPGLFTVSGLDDEYCPKTFDAQIIDQLTAICRNYVSTNQFLREGTADESLRDMAISFTVRLHDGHITDILP